MLLSTDTLIHWLRNLNRMDEKRIASIYIFFSRIDLEYMGIPGGYVYQKDELAKPGNLLTKLCFFSPSPFPEIVSLLRLTPNFSLSFYSLLSFLILFFLFGL
jgi:hypothetical protein